jgi:aminoglycoside 3-N-acetyltransferase
MVDTHYTQAELAAAIRACGIAAGDVVSVQVSLGRLGLPAGVPGDYPSIASLVIDTFLDVLGARGTLIVPTYTYSIGRGETFVVEETPSAIGEFSDLFWRRDGVLRSRDPMMSSAGIGPQAEKILRNISNSSYGYGSVFDNIRSSGGKICTLGLGIWWATYCHYIERIASVPFRFDKEFNGYVREGQQTRLEKWIYFAAPRVPNCKSNSIALENSLRAARLLPTAKIGRAEIACIDAEAFLMFGLDRLKENPWFTAKGPPAPPEDVFRDEPQYWQRQ